MKTIFIAICLLVASFIHSQNYEWAKGFGGNSIDEGFSISVDAAGNVYTTGWFQGTVDFDPGVGTTNLTAVGDYDIFVQKMDASGNFLWAKAFGGNGWEKGFSINVGPSENVYISGFFSDTVDFDPGTGTTTLISEGQNDIFVQKLDASGNFLWARSFGETGSDLSYATSVDASGNFYTTGCFEGTVDFDPGAGTASHTSVGDRDIFILKLDASGNFIWAKSFGGIDDENGNSIYVDDNGNIYTTGFFRETVDFDPGAGVAEHTVLSGRGIFVQKLDHLGNFLWAKTLGSYNDWGRCIRVDNSGNVYVAGEFNETVDFDPGTGIEEHTSAGSQDIFVLKLDALGNFIWAKTFGGTGFDRARSLCIDAIGNTYSAGYFNETVDFDPDPGTSHTYLANTEDAFIHKLDANGDLVWVKVYGGPYTDWAQFIEIDNSGNIYTTGRFEDMVDFDPGTGTDYMQSIGYSDIYVHKMSQVALGIIEPVKGMQISTYPNPSNGLVQLSFEKIVNNVEITLTDLHGKVVFSKKLTAVSNEQINIEGSAGIYFLTVKTPESQTVVKLIKE